MKREPTVLFLCTHNAVRSQMAEAFLRHLARAASGSGISYTGGGNLVFGLTRSTCMAEDSFVRQVQTALSRILAARFVVEKGAPLLHRLQLDDDLGVTVENPREPSLMPANLEGGCVNVLTMVHDAENLHHAAVRCGVPASALREDRRS
jgi:hypothetical protein